MALGATLLLGVFLISVTTALGKTSECLGAPFLYMTTHGGNDEGEFNEVLKYSRNGCVLGLVTKSDDESPYQLRGMVFDGNEMLVANGYKYNSVIWKYSTCKTAGVRTNEGMFIKPFKNSGLEHPYDMALDAAYVYTTNQNSNLVTRHLRTDGSPQTRSDLIGKKNTLDGAFVDFSKDSLRGITIDSDSGRIFVANRDGDSMVMLNAADGSTIDSYTIDHPIGVFYSASRRSVFVGSCGDDSVQELAVPSLTLLQEYKHKYLNHPTGITVYSPEDGADVMFVVSQDEEKLLAFELDKIQDMEKPEGTGLGGSENWDRVETVIDFNGLTGENLVLSPC